MFNRPRRVLTVSLGLGVLMLSGCASGSSADIQAASASTRQVTVYDFARVKGHLLLSPEKTTVHRSADPVRDAVHALFEFAPTGHGRETLWNGSCAPGLGVRETHSSKRLITVVVTRYPPDNVPNATCDLSVEGWNVQKQQVAWTVHAATGSKTAVRVVLDDDYTVFAHIVARVRYLAPQR